MSQNNVAVHNLPIRPGATLSFTIDWQAFWADQAGLTIAVDSDSDGKAERTRKIGGRTADGKLNYEIELTPESPEFVELFGAGIDEQAIE